MSDFWESQARSLLTLVEKTAQLLCDNAAVIAEYSGDDADLRQIVQAHGRIGESMNRAAVRTHATFDAHGGDG